MATELITMNFDEIKPIEEQSREIGHYISWI